MEPVKSDNCSAQAIVPRTDTGALGEKPKAYGVITEEREFGKLAP